MASVRAKYVYLGLMSLFTLILGEALHLSTVSVAIGITIGAGFIMAWAEKPNRSAKASKTIIAAPPPV